MDFAGFSDALEPASDRDVIGEKPHIQGYKRASARDAPKFHMQLNALQTPWLKVDRDKQR